MANTNTNRFGESLSRAKNIINMQKNGTFDSKVRNIRESGKIDTSILNEDYDPLASATLASPKQYVDYNKMPRDVIAQKSQGSKLPKAILESMTENPINTEVDGFGGTVGASVLDTLGLTSEHIGGNGGNDEDDMLLTEIAPTPRQQYVQQPVPQYSVPTQTVDYSIIKMIIEEAVRKNVAALKKTIISESAKNNSNTSDNVKVLKLANDKLQFLTSDGDLYEAKLEFKKNIKNK